ncbi:type I restriction-modification system DNA methylase subunit [Tenacibaculum adriaticum]|uniref:site-specific DNA-methyltransferase (adenine-specific) n=1 Tax=Tenacibaculum adriaticum TaxID=413713 RepID=A0A5S5DW59_9FLAO|nr:N-6 DNA methylase [Tenacibaculum adriaticum]TYQ00211.1 type I restriction-modification system DNA methylase subunit [Tenacibaculum adriaticum]
MIDFDIIENLGLDKAISVTSESDQISESQSVVVNQVRNFGIDEIYFSTDENNNSYPAVFLKKVEKFDDRALHQIAKAQKKIWNFKKVIFLYVYSETEIRIYNCAEKPLIIKSDDFDYKKELKILEIESYKFKDKTKLKQLQNLFSTIAIDTGIIWTLEEAYEIRKKISLQRRVDKYLVESLTHTAKQLQEEGLEINLIHKIIMRSLFLLYLEDRGATDEKFYSEIKNGAKSYFDILDDADKTYSLFQKLEEYFNGNVFTVDKNESISREHLQIVKKCFINGNNNSIQQNLFEDLRLFDFSIIQIELLSEIYENFLAEINPTLKQDTGTYYTPPSLVELILNEKLPISRTEKEFNVKVLDPTCGSGIFLVESFKRLVKRYENAKLEKLTDFNKLKKLLTDNIFGVEIHPQSIKVAAFSLYLALVDNLNPKTIWQNKDYRLPYLINDPSDDTLVEQGNNLFRSDTIQQNPEVEQIDFDLVVGNPPFGTKNLSQSIRDYSDKYGFAKEMVLPFLHKATTFSENGEIALIFNTKILTNTKITYQNFRKWLFNECYVEKIYNFSILRNAPKDFGGQLFGSATGPISVVFYQKHPPKKKSNTIVYYAPKTFIKSNVIEGVSIDSSDLKFLPREECEKQDTKIWKVAMWGGLSDFRLIEKLNNNKYQTIEQFNKTHSIESGVGFQLLTQKKDEPRHSKVLSELPYLDASSIERFYTQSSRLKNIKDSVKTPKSKSFYKAFYSVNDIDEIEELSHFRRLGDIQAFVNTHIVVKKGLEKNSVCSSLIDVDCSFRDGVYGFYSSKNDSSILNVLNSYFNSKLSSYYLFMTISSYGIEREQIMKNEYLSIPINLKEFEITKILKLSEKFIKKIKGLDFWNIEEKRNQLITTFSETVEGIINKSFGLNEDEINLLNDALDYSMDLFHSKAKSEALNPVRSIEDYSKKICGKLNQFLKGQNLFANATVFETNHFSPLLVMKLSFEENEKEVLKSQEDVTQELQKLDRHLWTKQSTNIYFRKKLNYKTGNEIFIVRPNQKRFWTQSMAIEDASELILEILNEV